MMICWYNIKTFLIGGGQGEKIERLYREVRAYAIPGGSEGNVVRQSKRSVY
jgi:hypothetical protein